MKRFLLILLICSMVSIFGSVSVFGQNFVTITTATTGGSFYPSGVALAQLLKEKLSPELGISFSAVSSAGSVENAEMLKQGEAEIGYLQNNVILWAYHGIRDFKGKPPFEKLRTLTPIFSSQYHWFVKPNINSLSEVKGKRVVVGRPGSGTETSTRLALEALGITYDDITPEFIGQAEAADALKDGIVDVIQMTGGSPIAAVTDLMSTPAKRFKFLNVPEEEVSAIYKAEPWMMPMTIPAGTYPNQPEDIRTNGHFVYLATTTDMSKDLAYKIVKTIFENLDWLRESYAAWKKLSLDKVDKDFLSFDVPVHEGALQYYREVGIVK